MNSEGSEIKEGSVIIQFTDSSRRVVETIDWLGRGGKREKDAADSNWHLLGEVKEGERYLSEAKRLRRSPELAEQRKRLDKYTCEACGYSKKIGNIFIVDCHHLEMLSSTGGTKTTIENLMTLCPNCHRIAHQIDQDGKAWSHSDLLAEIKTVLATP